MASHIYHELYVHLVWHTKQSFPLLDADLEHRVHEYLLEKCRKTKGVYFHGVGGIKDHIHLAVNYEPNLSVSEIVKTLKGSCAHDINKLLKRKAVEWQRGYGAVSFGMKNLPDVQKYIQNQKENHKSGKIYDRMERIRYDEENGQEIQECHAAEAGDTEDE